MAGFRGEEDPENSEWKKKLTGTLSSMSYGTPPLSASGTGNLAFGANVAGSVHERSFSETTAVTTSSTTQGLGTTTKANTDMLSAIQANISGGAHSNVSGGAHLHLGLGGSVHASGGANLNVGIEGSTTTTTTTTTSASTSLEVGVNVEEEKEKEKSDNE